jgi:hypothetical protein
MNAKQIMMGAAAAGCIITMTMSGVSAQEQDSVNGRLNARVGGSHMQTSGQLNGAARQSARERQDLAAGRDLSGERRMATENRRPWRGNDRELDRVAVERDGGAWRSDRWAYRGADRPVGVDAGVATGAYAWQPGYYAYSGYGPGPLYAYAPGYSVGPYYGDAYAPGFSVGIGPIGIGIGPYWD